MVSYILLFHLPHTTFIFFFFLNDPATPEFYTLPLHDALPIWQTRAMSARDSASSSFVIPVNAGIQFADHNKSKSAHPAASPPAAWPHGRETAGCRFY